MQTDVTQIRPLIVGLGPYCINAHLNFLYDENIIPVAVVELESRKNQTRLALDLLQFKKCAVLLVPDTNRDLQVFNPEFESKLKELIETQKPTHAILSCEPRGKFAYLDFFIRQGIPCFTDKPLTAPVNATVDAKQAKRAFQDFQKLAVLYRKAKTQNLRVDLNVKRRYHPGYKFILENIKEVTKKFEIPVTHIDISASDGQWDFPNEYHSRENHPYKYGYGKLYHTGYHYVDLLAQLIRAGSVDSKMNFNKVEATAKAVRPDDALALLDQKFYSKHFPEKDFSNSFSDKSLEDFKRFGEIDVYSVIQFMKDESALSSCALNLLSTSFSRRSWPNLPVDTYRSNGRVRHERTNIHIGPLMNIQFQEYGILRQDSDHEEFDRDYPISEVLIFRNTNIIGGKVFEKIPTDDLVSRTATYEESVALKEFLFNQPSSSDLLDHELSIFLMSLISKALATSRTESGTIKKKN